MNNSLITGLVAPDFAEMGSAVAAVVTMRNTGTSTWTAGSGYKLGAVRNSTPPDDPTWATTRVLLADDVPPGGQASFSIAATAPALAGLVPFSWRMLQEGVEWFGDVASHPIVVMPPQRHWPGPPANPAGLVRQMVVETGAYVPDARVRIFPWANRTGHTLHVKEITLWAGMDALDSGGHVPVADLDVKVVRASDRSLLAHLAWDHYAQPVSPTQQRYEFDPFFELLPGDSLLWQFSASNVAGHVAFVAEMAVLYLP